MMFDPHTHDRRKFLAAGLAVVVAAGAAPVLAGAATPDQAWQAAMARYVQIEAALSNDPDNDELGSALCEAQAELMNMPSPNNAALRWKLDRLVGSHEMWTDAYLRQPRTDYARLLGDA